MRFKTKITYIKGIYSVVMYLNVYHVRNVFILGVGKSESLSVAFDKCLEGLK